jgi:hypothetical protein
MKHEAVKNVNLFIHFSFHICDVLMSTKLSFSNFVLSYQNISMLREGRLP